MRFLGVHVGGLWGSALNPEKLYPFGCTDFRCVEYRRTEVATPFFLQKLLRLRAFLFVLKVSQTLKIERGIDAIPICQQLPYNFLRGMTSTKISHQSTGLQICLKQTSSQS